MEKHTKEYAEQLARKEFPYNKTNDNALFIKIQEWRIDCFNLILRNLAVPVTEDFNPYK